MEAEVGTKKLGDRQSDRGECVSRSRQIEVGRSGMQAVIHAGRWVGRRRWLAVAGPKREAGTEKETSRDRWAESCRQAGCQAGRKGIVGWEEETSRQTQHGRKNHAVILRQRQAKRGRQEIQAGRDAGREQPFRQRHRSRRMQR
jgi:hypothetical protein